jgi:hypothetical protein
MEQRTEFLKVIQKMMETGFLVSQIEVTQAKTGTDIRDMREEMIARL